MLTSLAFYFIYSIKLADFDKTLEAAVLGAGSPQNGYSGGEALTEADIIAMAEALGMSFATDEPTIMPEITPEITPVVTQAIEPLPPIESEPVPSPEASTRPTQPPTPDYTPAQTPVIPSATPVGSAIEPMTPQSQEPSQSSDIEPLNTNAPVVTPIPAIDADPGTTPEQGGDETVTAPETTAWPPEVRQTPSYANNESKGTVTVKIPDGQTATEISRLLESAGLVENAQDFLQVLRDKGYTMTMASGTFNLTVGMDYDAIAEALVRKKR